jgi:hypothetical protein
MQPIGLHISQIGSGTGLATIRLGFSCFAATLRATVLGTAAPAPLRGLHG